MAAAKTGTGNGPTALSGKPGLALPQITKPAAIPAASTSVAAVTAALPKIPPEVIAAVKTTASRAPAPVAAASELVPTAAPKADVRSTLPALAEAAMTEPVTTALVAPKPSMTEPEHTEPAPVLATPVPVAPIPVAAGLVVPAVATAAVAAAPAPRTVTGSLATMDATPAPLPGAPDPSVTKQKTQEFAMTTTEEFLSQGQANVEAVIKSGQIWATGVQDISRTLAESAQAHFEHNVATWKALAGTKSLKEAFDIQSSRTRAAMEKAVADTGKLTDASLKLAEQTMAPITQRLSVATEKLVRAN